MAGKVHVHLSQWPFEIVSERQRAGEGVAIQRSGKSRGGWAIQCVESVGLSPLMREVSNRAADQSALQVVLLMDLQVGKHNTSGLVPRIKIRKYECLAVAYS